MDDVLERFRERGRYLEGRIMVDYKDVAWEHGNPLFGDWGKGPRASDPDVVFLPTPIGVPCMYCDEAVIEGDVGEFMHYTHMGDETTVVPVHRECLLLAVVGHNYGYCNCNEYNGLSDREAALAVARLVDAGKRPLWERE